MDLLQAIPDIRRRMVKHEYLKLALRVTNYGGQDRENLSHCINVFILQFRVWLVLTGTRKFPWEVNLAGLIVYDKPRHWAGGTANKELLESQ